MKKMFLVAMALFMSVAFVSCDNKSNNEESNTATADSLANVAAEAIEDLEAATKAKVAEFGDGLFGTFVATLPAADASGIEATLVLNGDLTYTLSEKFIGKEEVEPTTGKITNADFAKKIITLTDADGNTSLFKVVDSGNLLMLNADETEPVDVAAYTFVRQ